ncbi:hypothetical protein BOX15_Mlig002221g1 [Macrostomum lignano]|uniref:B box-type domain-containing protein n=2 Tax=Macrostomum lignano TaxID=282301 RepID=A0A267H3Q1_9PLAT|nr:hypothetical protein BOX15_Mlig002221g1 [Macrostomum lignano]
MSDEMTHAYDDILEQSSPGSQLLLGNNEEYNQLTGRHFNIGNGNNKSDEEDDAAEAAGLLETFGNCCLDGDDAVSQQEAAVAKAASLAGDCSLCQRPLTEPVFLACLHRFDLPCLQASRTGLADLVLFCPKCHTPTVLDANLGLAGLTRDHLYMREAAPKAEQPRCGGCTTGAEAVARCRECADYLCQACRQAHSVMKMFSRHRVRDLASAGGSNGNAEASNGDNDDQGAADDDDDADQVGAQLSCAEHPAERTRYYCHDCAGLHCAECVATGHKLHRVEPALSAGRRLVAALADDAKKLRDCQRKWQIEHVKMQERLTEIEDSRQHNEGAIREALASYKAFIEEAGNRMLEENRKLHSDLEMRVMEQLDAVAKGADQMSEAAAFVRAYSDRAGPVCAAYAAKVLRDWAATLMRSHWDTDLPASVPFKANHAEFRSLVLSNFGRFVTPGGPPTPTTTAVPANAAVSAAAAAAAAAAASGMPVNAAAVAAALGEAASGDLQQASAFAIKPEPAPAGPPVTYATGNNPALFGLPSQPSPGAPGSDSGVSIGSEPLLSSVLGGVGKLQLDVMQQQFDFASLVGVGAGGGAGSSGAGSIVGGGAPGSASPTQQNPKSSVASAAGAFRTGRCIPMTVRHRWGSLGSAIGQFNSPHGFCLGPEEDIVVADTQNHRIQIFDKSGEHKSQFGIAGREEGQLWYPRKVAVMRQSSRFVVCDRGSERSRMQLFSKTGQFLRKITVRYIDIVAGLAINSQQHIVAVDSVSPTVFVIADTGDLVKWFDCSSYMREPSDIAIQGREYFICDFKGHCVCVFQDDGVFLRRIGSEVITNFPNGIDISDHGDVLVGDSHGNKFHVAVFNSAGQLTSEFECPAVKVSRCCGLKITSEGYVVTLAKNNHHVLVLNTLYIS